MRNNIKLREIKCGLHCIVNTETNDCIKTIELTMPYDSQHGASVEGRAVTGQTLLLTAAYRGQCNAAGECCHCLICRKYYWESMDSLHVMFGDSMKYL
jgi:hypothetical protein